MTRRVVAVTMAALVALTLAWYFLLWSPDANDIRTAHSQLAAAQASDLRLSGQVASLAKVKARQQELRSQLSTLEAAIPASPQLAATIDQINGAAARAGVALTTISPQQVTASLAASPVASTGPPALSMNLAVGGSYYQIMNFLYYLNKTPRLIVVDTIDMSSAGANGKLSAQLATRLFYGNAPASSTATSSPGA